MYTRVVASKSWRVVVKKIIFIYEYVDAAKD